MIEYLQEHLRGAHRGKAVEECPACHTPDGADSTDETPKGPRKAAVQPDSGEARSCECGCGAVVRSRFLPGHDAKLKSRLLREARTGGATDRLAARSELERRGWLKFLVEGKGKAIA